MRFVVNERLCCPFGIAVSPVEGPVRLRLSGPPGTRPFLDAEPRLA